MVSTLYIIEKIISCDLLSVAFVNISKWASVSNICSEDHIDFWWNQLKIFS